MSLTLTLIRHGESTDNLKSLWAGHRDAPLTTHGMNQARRLGKSFEDLYITKIYASDLKRAHWTALQVATQNKGLLARIEAEQATTSSSNGQQGKMPETDTSATLASEGMNDLEGESGEEIAETEPGPSSIQSTDRSYASAAIGTPYEDDFSCSSSAAASSPIRNGTDSNTSPNASPTSLLPRTVTTTPFLREQFFGLAEGQNWKTGYATSSNSYHNRNYRFEQGESLEDVGNRAEEIMKRCVVPWLVRAAKTGKDEHVVLVAHGIMISELLFALSRLQDPRAIYERRSGHTNTGWTRLKLTLPANFTKSDSLADPVIPHLMSADLPPHYNSTSSSSSASASAVPISSLPKITLRQTHTNITTHLNGLKRTKGGVGSEGFDSRQKSLKQFFSGGGGGDDVSVASTPKVPDPPVDLTESDNDSTSKMEDGNMTKTNGEAQKRGIRLKSPASPSPKKGRLT